MSQTIHQAEGEASRTRDRHELGRRVAGLLAGAWREPDQTAENLSEAELKEIVPLLCDSGAGALAWRQIRNTPLADTESGRQLQEVYRRHRLSALIHEREIAYVLSLLRAEGIEPVLIKGWAIARRYPDSALRPYGDIDLCIRPDQFAQACAALMCLEEIDGHYVDLHCGFARIGQTRPEGAGADGRGRRQGQESAKQELARRVWDELCSRSQLVPLGQESRSSLGARAPSPAMLPEIQLTKGPFALRAHLRAGAPALPVRILSDEDHLRILSAHLLRSGARRPSWLCDAALLLETRAKDFDWDVCLGRGLDRNVNRNLNWIATTIGMAQQLLGANVEIKNAPLAARVENLPRWLVPAMLRQWGRSRAQIGSPTVREGSADGIVTLWTRFDDPVRATAAVGGQFNNWPRLPYRVAELATRLPEVPRQLHSLLEQFAVRPVRLRRRTATTEV